MLQRILTKFAAPSGALVLIGVVLASAFGAAALSAGKFHAFDVDFAHHYALVGTLMDFWGVPGDLRNLSEMRIYPRLSHWIAALVGHATGSGLAAMSHVSVASAALLYLGLFALTFRVGIVPAVASAALLLGLVVLRLSVRMMFGFEVVGSFFFAQIVGSALFVWALWGLATAEGKIPSLVLDLLAVAAFALIGFAHLLPALQFAGTYGLVLLYGAVVRPGRATFVRLGLYGALATIVLVLHPTVPVMTRIADHNGGIFFSITMTSVLRLAIPSVAAAIAAALLVYGHRVGRPEVRWLSAAGLACSALAVSQFAMFHFTGRSSPYAVDKHMYAVFTFGLVNAATLAGLAWSGRQTPMTPLAASALGLAALVTAHLVVSRLSYDARPILQYQAMVRAALPELPRGIRAVVHNRSFVPTLNYLITIGDLRSPRRRIGNDVLEGRPLSKDIDFVFVSMQDPALSGPCAVQPYPMIDYRCLSGLSPTPDTRVER